MQACAPALRDTALQNAIHLSPRCETRAEGCYCINIGKEKTPVMWRTMRDRLERAGNAGTRAECKACFAVRDPTSLCNKQHWGWMRNKADLSGSNAQGEYIFSEKTERERERERAGEKLFEMYAQTKWKKKHWTVRWLSDRSIDLYLKGVVDCFFFFSPRLDCVYGVQSKMC